MSTTPDQWISVIMMVKLTRCRLIVTFYLRKIGIPRISKCSTVLTLVSTLCSQLMVITSIFQTEITPGAKFFTGIINPALLSSTFLEKMAIYPINYVGYSRTMLCLQDLLKSEFSQHTSFSVMDTFCWMLAMKAIFQTYSMGKSICKLTKPGKQDIHCTHRTKSFFTTIRIDTIDPYSTSTRKKVSHQKKSIALSEMREKHRSARFVG